MAVTCEIIPAILQAPGQWSPPETLGASARLDPVAGICRFGVPLPPGRLQHAAQLGLWDCDRPVPIVAEPLARWPDGSLRLVGVRFEVIPAGDHVYCLVLNAPVDRCPQMPATALPEPPADLYPGLFLQLPGEFLCRSESFGGPLRTASMLTDPQTDAARIAERLDRNAALDLQQSVWTGVVTGRIPTNYARGLHEFFYYDLSHAAYQQYLRTGDFRLFTAAYAAERVYREKMIVHDGPHAGQAGDAQATNYPEAVKMNGRWAAYWKVNTADELIPWNGLRTLYIEGLLDDWQLTADPRSFHIARLVADALVKDIPKQGLFLRINERNPGWPLVELTYFYDIVREEKYLATAKLIVDDLLQWQAPTGGWLREYEDEAECPHRCVGGQPFMHSILLQGLIRYHDLTGDQRVRACLLKGVDWLLTDAAGWRPEQGGWVYLPGCKDNRNSQKISADLSVLICHPLAYA